MKTLKARGKMLIEEEAGPLARNLSQQNFMMDKVGISCILSR